MGPNNLCYVTRHFLFFPYVAMSLFIRPCRHFYSFYKRPRQISTTFKVAVSYFVFYPCGALIVVMQEVIFIQYPMKTLTAALDRSRTPIYITTMTYIRRIGSFHRDYRYITQINGTSLASLLQRKKNTHEKHPFTTQAIPSTLYKFLAYHLLRFECNNKC